MNRRTFLGFLSALFLPVANWFRRKKKISCPLCDLYGFRHGAEADPQKVREVYEACLKLGTYTAEEDEKWRLEHVEYRKKMAAYYRGLALKFEGENS